MLNRIAIVFCAVWLGARPSLAQEPTIPEQLTLSQALAIAGERNPALTAARSDVDIAAADRIGARLRPNPALTLDSEGYPLGF